MDIPAGNSRALRWQWVVVFWAGLGMFNATENVFSMRAEGMHHAWITMFWVLTFSWLPWALATPLVIHLAPRYPIGRAHPRHGLIHLGAVMAIALCQSAWSTLLEMVFRPYAPDQITSPFIHGLRLKFFGALLPALILYGFTLAVSFVLDSRARLAAQQTDTARLNEQLAYAKMNALQRQIEPHFLFNALNAIAGLVRDHQNAAAVKMIVSLSELLRRVAASNSDPKTTLANEMQFLEKYLQIQEARFAGRLSVDIDIPDELRRAQVPSLMLQPLVENAIKHGIAKRSQGGAVRVTAARSEDKLKMHVYNDGPPVAVASADAIGLSNLRTRLALLYGSDFVLRLENYTSSGVMVSIELPYTVA